MKAVVLYETANVPMEKIMEVYLLHKMLVDTFANDKKVIAIGRFICADGGSMGIFINKEVAEDFVRKDPFVLEGIAAKVTIKEWDESLLP